MKKQKILFTIFISLLVSDLAVSSTGPVDNPIVIGNARFTVITPALIRIEYAFDQEFLDEQTYFAFDRSNKTNKYLFEQNGDEYFITTEKMQLKFIDTGSPISDANLFITVYNTPDDFVWTPRYLVDYMRDTTNLGGALSTLDMVTERVPTNDGLLTRNGWAVVDDTHKETIVEGWLSNRHREHFRDLYFFGYGKDYKAALRALTAISGKAPLTRKFAYGIGYCRWWDYSADEFLEVVQGYNDNDFPLDFMVLDMGWHTQDDATTGMGILNRLYWTGYSWNKELIPDPKLLIQKLHEKGLAVGLNDHPHDGIRIHEDAYPDFMRAMGENPESGIDLVFDAGNPKYMENFFKYAHGPHDSIGVDFWWLDWQQDYLIPSVLGFPRVQHLPWLNELYFRNSKRDNKRGIILSRFAGWGGHRYPFYFSGDARGNWEVLEFEVDFTQSSNNQGAFFWSHEVGGFYSVRDPELYVRWTQFALTTNTMRVHSSKDPDTDKRPWLWGEVAEKALRKIYHLRSELMPYIYTSAWQVSDQTLPLNRPMYLEYPHIEEAYNHPQQYLFGDLLLAAPITSSGKGNLFISSQQVWFPPGDKWYDVFNHQGYDGGITKMVKADINHTPLFVKGGVPLPLQPYTLRPATALLDTLIIRVYPGIPGQTRKYTLYEDDGVSQDYEKGYFLTTNLSYTQHGDSGTLIVEPANGMGYEGQVEIRTYRFEFPSLDAQAASINGESSPVFSDTEKQLQFIYSTPIPLNQRIVVNIQ